MQVLPQTLQQRGARLDMPHQPDPLQQQLCLTSLRAHQCTGVFQLLQAHVFPSNGVDGAI